MRLRNDYAQFGHVRILIASSVVGGASPLRPPFVMCWKPRTILGVRPVFQRLLRAASLSVVLSATLPAVSYAAALLLSPSNSYVETTIWGAGPRQGPYWYTDRVYLKDNRSGSLSLADSATSSAAFGGRLRVDANSNWTHFPSYAYQSSGAANATIN